MTPRRYPLDALAQRMGVSVHKMGEQLRVSGSTMQEYRKLGVSEKVADRLAVRAGFDPYQVWPEMADHLIEDNQRTCERRCCDTVFVPFRSNQRYCSPRCQKYDAQRRNMARRYANDPEFAEAKRVSRRAYYQECGDYERAAQRARYWAKRGEAA